MKIPNYGMFWECKTARKLIFKNGLIWNFDPLWFHPGERIRQSENFSDEYPCDFYVTSGPAFLNATKGRNTQNNLPAVYWHVKLIKKGKI